MLRASISRLRGTKSTQIDRGKHPLSGSRKGRSYNHAYRTYGPYGYGVGKMTTRKNRSVDIAPRHDIQRPRPNGSRDGPLSDVHRTMSKHWVPYALEDGGVLFTHPSTKEMLRWSHDTLREERKCTGMYSTTDADRDAKIKTLLERNSIEAQPIEAWRKKHIAQLLKEKLRIQRL